MTSLITQFAIDNSRWLDDGDGSVLGELAVANAFSHEIRADGVSFVDHASDPGGATNYGISLRFLQDMIDVGRVDAADFDHDFDGDVDGADMRELTLDQARDLLWSEFWQPYLTVDLPPPIAIKLFDMAVNMGQGQAVRLLQDALNYYLKARGLNPLTRDGVIGPKTIAAAVMMHENGVDYHAMLVSMRARMAKFYEDLVVKNPKFGDFIDGWLKRAAL